MPTIEDDPSAIQISQDYGDNDPNINSLKRYANLARQYDLIKHPVRIERDEQGVTQVQVEANFGNQTFTFPSVSKATHFLCLIYQSADYAVNG